ncbi:MAG: hypothetical protein ABL925_19570, partial [Methylococcales bacterium]
LRNGGSNVNTISEWLSEVNEEEKRSLSVAKDYLSLVVSQERPEDVVRRVRNFELSDNSCSPGGSKPSASGSILCGLASRLITNTIKLESVIQLTCHAGLPRPSFNNTKPQNSGVDTNQKATNKKSASNTDTSSNTKPLTKAELKAQAAEQAAQAAEQDVQQDTQLAQENQAKANKARQGKRRRHEPENEAHNCIKPDFGGLYGGMENTCNFKVWYTYCGYRPTENSWLTGMSCEKQSFGSDIVGPGKQSASHTHGVEKLYWFACKDPAWPVDVEFVDGDIKGRCHTVGGGSD